MPTFNRKKLFEVKGSLKTSTEEWKSEIKRVVKAQIFQNSYREGRAALVICETINTAEELYEELKSIIPGKMFLYSRSDKDKIDKILNPGDVIVATNLAGRGTDIKVSEQVNENGGLFVILSFLSDNTRVELQAFGRTARKGKPGSAQVIITTDHLQESFRTVSSLDEAKKTRDRLAAERIQDTMNDITEVKLREDLFSEYCETLQDIYRNTDGDEQRAVVAIMNEFWGIWLQTKSEEINQLKRNELQESLKADLSQAKTQSQSQTSPCSSIYHYIKFGNIALEEKQWDVSTKLFEKAMGQDESWAAIAFYNHAYCTIKQRKENYLTKATDDLRKAQESLKYLSEECMVCLQFVKMSCADSADSNPTSLEKQLTTRCTMLSYFDKNISEAIEKLQVIKDKKEDATVNQSHLFSLVSGADDDLQAEADNLYHRGLEYVFSVEEKYRFPWGALVVLSLGVLQIVGGAVLTVCTVGILAQVGFGLIAEGISDCISAITSMKSSGSGEYSQSHAEKIRNNMTAGTILDIRVLSEATGTKVVILTEDSHGKLTKMQELSPGTKPVSQTVTLIYRPKSSQYPDGHYDVCINNQTVTVTSQGKSCLFNAFARGLKPEGSNEEITLKAGSLRSLEVDTLLEHPGQWEPFVKRKEWTDKIRGGDCTITDWINKEGYKNQNDPHRIKVLSFVNGKFKK
ncbi:uncharacterized protein AKAME5_001991500 [Lates japonicus]|uniref:SECA2 n=1 Tax=Lates japonicus TaxID=270547 RepID=A0AAD3NB52_LATJO|nr:uncharacterized protein AKAME5_001991500 [Lates japonicus]